MLTVLTLVLRSSAASPSVVGVVQSSEAGDHWKAQPDLVFAKDNFKNSSNSVSIHTKIIKQEVMGFGAAMTDTSAYNAMVWMDSDTQDAYFQALWGKTGLGFVEEDMDQEDISEKQYAKAEAKQRKLAASVASLRAQVAGAEGMVALAATVASPADLAARAERKRAAVQSAAVAAAAKSARKQPASVLQGGGRGGGYASGGGGGAHAAVKKAALVQPDSNSVEFVQANELRKGNYILINGRVCRVGDYSTSKTGKHGQ